MSNQIWVADETGIIRMDSKKNVFGAAGFKAVIEKVNDPSFQAVEVDLCFVESMKLYEAGNTGTVASNMEVGERKLPLNVGHSLREGYPIMLGTPVVYTTATDAAIGDEALALTVSANIVKPTGAFAKI